MSSAPVTVASSSSSGNRAAAITPQILVMVLLFSVAGLVESRSLTSLSFLSNGDIWWHLSSGLWMLQHHALPHAGIFSQMGSHGWIDTSWLYDLKLAIYYKVFGLRAIPIFDTFLKAGLAIVAFLLAGGSRQNGSRATFWGAVGLSTVAQYVLGAMPATPAYCSTLLFGITLLILRTSRSAGNAKMLFWLPPLFLVWANLDIHFVYGLALLLLFAVTEAVKKTFTSAASQLEGRTFLIVAAAFLATVVTPYFYRPWQVFFTSAFGAANSYLPAYKAPGFRQPQDYVLLVLVMSAFLALGLRRSRDIFLIVTLALGAVLSFHSQRDVWLAVLVSVVVIGEMASSAAASSVRATRVKPLVISAASAVVILALAVVFFIPAPTALVAKAAQSYPVAAGDYIRERHLPQPIFNAFEWGGFLTFYLPEYPVAIDGRVDLYGDDLIANYSKTMNAKLRYTDFPALANAATIVLPHSSIMAQALSTLPAYKVVYSDDVATVLTKAEEVKQ